MNRLDVDSYRVRFWLCLWLQGDVSALHRGADSSLQVAAQTLACANKSMDLYPLLRDGHYLQDRRLVVPEHPVESELTC